MATLTQYLQGIKTKFAMSLMTGTKPQSDVFSETVISDNDEELYPIMSVLPGFRETEGFYSFEDFATYIAAVKNKEYHAGWQLPRNLIEDSIAKVGNLLTRWGNSIAEKWPMLHDKLLNTALIANDTAYDGTAFFANTRPALEAGSGNTLDNLIAGTGVTLATIYADINSMFAQFDTLVDKNGEPFNDDLQLVLYVPRHLYRTFEILRSSEIINLSGVSTTNDLKGTFEVRKNWYQSTSDNDWYGFNASKKPVLNQIRKNVESEYQDSRIAGGVNVKGLFTGRRRTVLVSPVHAVKCDN